MTLTNLLVDVPMMLLCLVIEVAVSFWCVRYYIHHLIDHESLPSDGFLAGVWPLIVAMLVMMLGNFVQIGLWSTLFVYLGEFGEVYDALYHSAVNFSSLGYGDIVMTKQWRLLGPLEALNGVLMLGMTAAALMVILQHMIKSQRDALIASQRD